MPGSSCAGESKNSVPSYNFPCLCTNFPAEVSENSLLRCIGNSRIRSSFRKVFFALSEANFRANDEKFPALSRLSGNFARLPFQEPSTIYAGVGASLTFEPSTGAGERRGERAALEEDDLITYRKLAAARIRSASGREASHNKFHRRDCSHSRKREPSSHRPRK
jgi:hypothetical protein